MGGWPFNVSKMKPKIAIQAAVFSLSGLLLLGCNSETKRENEALKKEAAELQQQLREIRTEVVADKSALENVTKELSETKKAKEKAEKALEIYRDKASSAYRELKSLRGIFDESSVKLDEFSRSYLSAKMEITKLVDVVPESQMKRQIISVLQLFSDIKTIWEKSNQDMEDRQDQGNRELRYWIEVDSLDKGPLTKIGGQTDIKLKTIEAVEAVELNRILEIHTKKRGIDQQLEKLKEALNSETVSVLDIVKSPSWHGAS